MPIKPENRSRYPADWKQIRERILARAENRCEQCCVPNRIRIARGAGEDIDTYMTDDAKVYCAETGTYLGQTHMSNYEVLRMVNIVLTIAHLDHTRPSTDDDNLKALCQRCHLRYDHKHHIVNAHATRRAKLNNLDLEFDRIQGDA